VADHAVPIGPRHEINAVLRLTGSLNQRLTAAADRCVLAHWARPRRRRFRPDHPIPASPAFALVESPSAVVALRGRPTETCWRSESRDVSAPLSAPEGITNPPIDELLERTQSKYALVIIAAKRARQINAYYSQLGEGLLEYVGPLVETAPQEKPLSIALREINADLIEFKATD
jgi:DNA-directed RNA polymerase subunit omega